MYCTSTVLSFGAAERSRAKTSQFLIYYSFFMCIGEERCVHLPGRCFDLALMLIFHFQMIRKKKNLDFNGKISGLNRGFTGKHGVQVIFLQE